VAPPRFAARGLQLYQFVYSVPAIPAATNRPVQSQIPSLQTGD
jgi:hypothetical protein